MAEKGDSRHACGRRCARPRKPGVQTYPKPAPRGLELSYETATPGTGSSITSAMTLSAAGSPCCGGSGALVAAFFVTARFALVLVTRFFGAVLAATRLAILVWAARLGVPRAPAILRTWGACW